jgi:hypothetical protein
LPVASRIVFQVDQAGSSNKVVLRYKRERCEKSNLDRRISVCTGGHREEKMNLHDLSLYAILQIVSVTFSEKPSLLEVLTASQYNSCTTADRGKFTLEGVTV